MPARTRPSGPRRRFHPRRFVGLLLTMAVIAVVRPAVREALADGGLTTRGEKDAATTTTLTADAPVADVCTTNADGNPSSGLTGRSDAPAPVPDAPGQHALLVKHDSMPYGNIDLAPGGGFVLGANEASDAKTVFVICAIDAEPNLTGETCEFTGGGYEASTVQLARARLDLHVYEVRSGRYLGTATVEGTGNGCPGMTWDWRDGVLELTDGLDGAYVQWVRDHLTGARFTP